MKKKWILPDRERETDLLRTILKSRGILTDADVTEFLSQKPSRTHDPFLMKGLREAAERILAAAEEQRSIWIYGDYDADGVCSVSLLLDIIRKLTPRVDYYIPSRFEEGYGLNKAALRDLKDRGAELVVTVDCGSVSYAEAQHAEALGLELIVTDHHNLNDQMVECLLVNPKQPGCLYPEKGLAGCGVAFKLAQGLERMSHVSKRDLSGVLDLVAIATIGDMVPLQGENRTLVKYGLRRINQNKRPGLHQLIQGIGLKPGGVESEQVAFGIVPHLNAAGRMERAEIGVDLLSSEDRAVYEEAAELLISHNRERRRIQEETVRDLRSISDEENDDASILLIDGGDAHEGITGIVAGKIKDRYHKPTIVVTDSEDGGIKGTGRSIEGVDLYVLLSSAAHLFEKFGGHSGACGFSMDRQNLPKLRQILKEETRKLQREDPELFCPKVRIDVLLLPKDVNRGLVEDLQQLEPYGYGNPKPVIGLKNQSLTNLQYMGEHQTHARFQTEELQGILFQKAQEYKDLLEGETALDLAGYPSINRWKGQEKIQFVTAEMRWYNESNGAADEENQRSLK